MISRNRLIQQAKKLLSLDCHPGHIAAGLSVGVFISFIPPVPGLHTALALAVSFLFRLNKVACLAGTWVNSPITIIPSLVLSYKLGALILGCQKTAIHVRGIDWPYIETLLIHHAKPLLLGCSIIGFVAAVIAYFVCYWGIVFARRKDDFMAEMTREMEEVGEELE